MEPDTLDNSSPAIAIIDGRCGREMFEWWYCNGKECVVLIYAFEKLWN